MKLATMSFIRTFILILTPFVLFAQEDKDYSILLNSGKFTPTENIITLNKDASIFRNSSFGNKHYVTLQFRAIPSDAMKAQMKSAGIELIDYIPNLADFPGPSGYGNVRLLPFPHRVIENNSAQNL